VTDVTPEEMHAIGMVNDSAPTPIKDVLPGTAQAVEQTIAEKQAFRSRTKVSKYDRRDMILLLCTNAFDKVRAGVALEKAVFGLTAREKEFVATLVAEYREWEKDPAAYTASFDEPTKQE
jgi:enoyl-CoA hydratase/carnithine racemase